MGIFYRFEETWRKGNKYLTEVLSEAATFDEFVAGLFDSLLRFDCQTSIFGQVYDQRKKILKGITGYNPLLANYLKNLQIRRIKLFII